LTFAIRHDYLYTVGDLSGGWIMAAIAIAAAATHSTLTPYLAIPIVVVAMGIRVFLWRRRR
jgi:hypothetical protein